MFLWKAKPVFWEENGIEMLTIYQIYQIYMYIQVVKLQKKKSVYNCFN